MDSQQFRDAATSAIDEIATFYENIGERRVVSNVEPGYLRKLLPEAPPEDGESWPDIQKDIEAKIVPGLTHWSSPNFMAFFPASSSYPGMLGELYSAAFTAPAFNWICSPAVTELETVVLDWLAKTLALPPCFLSTSSTGGGGVIQGSASEAVVTVMVAAREKYLNETTAHITDPEEREDAIGLKRAKLVAIASEMMHSSTQKAAQIAGVRFRSIPVSAANNFALTGPDLEKALKECRAKGLEPFFLGVTLGTTSTCAVDDFGAVADVLAADFESQKGQQPNGKENLSSKSDIWVHVDAAYAGAALVLPEYQHLSQHFDRFHSFDMNMHKWLLTNFDASCLFVRSRKPLLDALSITPSYLRNQFTASGLVTDYRDWQIPLGRRFRALKIWFVMRTYGVKGLRNHITRGIKLGEHFHSRLCSRPDLFSIVSGPTFALTVFTIKPAPDAVERKSEDEIAAEEHALTAKVYEAINDEGQIYITHTVVGGRYAIRVVATNERTTEKDMDRAFEIFTRMAEKFRGEVAANGKA